MARPVRPGMARNGAARRGAAGPSRRPWGAASPGAALLVSEADSGCPDRGVSSSRRPPCFAPIAARPSMTTRKTRAPKARPARRKGGEYRFHIDAYTPETMPIDRLAQYMAHLATILGESAAVHFERLEGGSTNLVSRIEPEAEPKVRGRIDAIERGAGDKAGRDSFAQLNRMLREDGAVGLIRYGKRGKRLLYFPGREIPVQPPVIVQEHAAIEGEVLRVGGSGASVPILLDVEGVTVTNCYAPRPLAKEIAAKLFEPVRLHGRGKWRRDEDGAWCLEEFRVERFETLRAETLGDALRALREIPADWGREPYAELAAMRTGEGSEGHGRS